MTKRKYTPDILAPMFIRAAILRNEMLDADFTDNGGAIHSAERIIDILGLALNYPQLTHRNGLKKFENAECSEDAFIARKGKKSLHIEHVLPLRAFTAAAIKIADPHRKGAEERLIGFVRANYRLVLLTPEERSKLDQMNRTRIDPRRLQRAGIKIMRQKTKK